MALLLMSMMLGLILCGALVHREQAGARPYQEAEIQDLSALSLGLEVYATGLVRPVDIAPLDLPGERRLFVAEQDGRVRIVDASGTVLPQPYLDISGRVLSSGERGLLGLAFDPDFAANGYLYANYTRRPDGASVISRFTGIDPFAADAASEHTLLVVAQPYANHNGGDLAFGPDGYLYISLGDGGSAGDPEDRAQDLGLLLGKLLRIDVDPLRGHSPDCGGLQAAYTIPTNNPMVDGPGKHCDEIWAYGLRNPWRFSFDRSTGDIFIGDVGQGSREEIDFQPGNSAGGENYGWRCYEGTSLYNGSGCGNPTDYRFPVFEYNHGAPDFHCSVTGGYRYRGGHFPSLSGRYLLADFCTGNVWSLVDQGSGGWQSTSHGALIANPSTFGEATDGELYLASRSNGTIYHVIDDSPSPRLSISKTGPLFAASAEPFTYTLNVMNQGALAATALSVTDTLPVGAVYLSSSHSGAFTNGAVRWNLANLLPGNQVALHLVMSATQTVVNQEYLVTASGGYRIEGFPPVLTLIDPQPTFLPVVPGP
jgi:uncharacterized repeat protein (TIGR01451 family)